MKIIYKFILLSVVLVVSCATKSPLDYALEQAGDNRHELELVLEHYKSDPEKLAAAEMVLSGSEAGTVEMFLRCPSDFACLKAIMLLNHQT